MAMHRKLTAIMFTDMQGYTAMMREDEEKAINLRNRHREIFERLTEKFRGTIVQYFGDGTLTAFDSSIDAVECALELQKEFRQQPIIPVRIGIHVGDIVYYENDIIGDAVNIASRIESVALPGAVYFSGHINDQLRSHKQFSTKYLDVFQFKNVKEAIPVFALIDDQIAVPESSELFNSTKKDNASSTFAKNDSRAKLKKRNKLILGVLAILTSIGVIWGFYTFRDTPTQSKTSPETTNSIAILPVQNLSGVSQNDMFCEAITNEMLQQLSKEPDIGGVVPKSLITDYLKQGKALTDLAKTLNVHYILESALHFSDSLYSLDVRLVDPIERKYLWSNRYEHISEINYNQIIETTIGEAISLQIDTDTRQQQSTVRSEVITENKTAYDLLTTADALTENMNKESFYKAIPLYEKAIQLDPQLAEAYLGLGRIHIMGGIIWGIFNQDEAASKSKAYLSRSLEIKPTLEASQFLLMTKFFFDQDFQYVEDHLSLVAILPSFPDGAFYAVYTTVMGRFEESILFTKKYVKRFPEAGNGFAQMTRAYFLSGQIKEADSLMRRYDDVFKNDQFYMRDVAMVHLNNGNMEAFKKMNHILKTNFLDNAAVHLYYDAVALTHDKEDSEKINERLDALKNQYIKGMAGSPAWFLAMYYFYLGDDDTAFEWLEKSHQRKEVEMVWFKTEYRLQPFKKAKDPRYMAIYNQMSWPKKKDL